MRGQLTQKPHGGEFSGGRTSVPRLDLWRAINAETAGARIPKILTLTNFPKSPFHLIVASTYRVRYQQSCMPQCNQCEQKLIGFWWDTFNSHHLWTVQSSLLAIWNDLKWEIDTLGCASESGQLLQVLSYWQANKGFAQNNHSVSLQRLNNWRKQDSALISSFPVKHTVYSISIKGEPYIVEDGILYPK